MSDWQSIGSVTGLTSGIQGIVQNYQAYISEPTASLVESERRLERKLKMVESRLQGLSPQRRAEIEIANRNNYVGAKSVEDLEDFIPFLMEAYYGLFEAKAKSMMPFSEARRHVHWQRDVRKLESDVTRLFNDTVRMTGPMTEFDPENPSDAPLHRRMAIPRSRVV